MSFLKIFGTKKSVVVIPTVEDIINLPTSENVFVSAQNKELTETKLFSDLLDAFQHFPLKDENLQQSINQHILCFKKNIYETSSWMSTIVRGISKGDTTICNFIRRLGMDQHKTYLFFTEKPSEEYATLDQKAIDQLVGWMKTVLEYYEKNKLNVMEENHEEICSAIHSKLNMFYDFYYYLLCHMVDVRCDNLSSVAKTQTVDF